jgi:hypothetical protein
LSVKVSAQLTVSDVTICESSHKRTILCPAFDICCNVC